MMLRPSVLLAEKHQPRSASRVSTRPHLHLHADIVLESQLEQILLETEQSFQALSSAHGQPQSKRKRRRSARKDFAACAHCELPGRMLVCSRCRAQPRIARSNARPQHGPHTNPHVPGSISQHTPNGEYRVSSCRNVYRSNIYGDGVHTRGAREKAILKLACGRPLYLV